MADIVPGAHAKTAHHSLVGGRGAPLLTGDAPLPLANAELITLVELMFFAYRDFTAEPDAILGEFGLGRAHHRVLHFVRRHPGLRVTDLLAILKITKQSLGRVLSALITDGWVDSREMLEDRRARLLFLTAKGEVLALRLANVQTQRVAAALASRPNAAPRDDDPVRGFLFAMIAPEDHKSVETLFAQAAPEPLTR
jgi:DNA-binding MarR family transcriptional regulator